MSLSAEAEKRKERLLALKKRKRGQAEDTETLEDTSTPPSNGSLNPQPDSSKPYLNKLPFLIIVSHYQAETTMQRHVQQNSASRNPLYQSFQKTLKQLRKSQ